MANDFDSASWVDHHERMSQDLDNWFDKLSYLFKRLNQIQYSAPWRRVPF